MLAILIDHSMNYFREWKPDTCSCVMDLRSIGTLPYH